MKKKLKTKDQVEREYKSKMLQKKREITLRFCLKKKKECINRGKYWKERCKKEVDRWTKKLNDKMEKEIKNIHRAEKGHKIVQYKKKVAPRGKEEMLVLLQKYVRLRDTFADGYGYCICCAKRMFWEKDGGCGGHYESRGKGSVAFNLDNINFQCKDCNGKMSGKRGMEVANECKALYRKNLVKKIGEDAVKQIEIDKYTINFDTRQFMTKDAFEHWEAKIAQLEAKKPKHP